jgi:hypothetical protein
MNRTIKKLIPCGTPHARRHPLEDGGVQVTAFVPLRFRKRGIQKVVVAPAGVSDPITVETIDAAIPPCPDPTLLRALARGFYWQDLLDRGVVEDAAEISEREGLHRVTVNFGLRLALLAPELVTGALQGNLPRTVTLEGLQRIAMPAEWEKQREILVGSSLSA